MTLRHDRGNGPDELEQPGQTYELTNRGLDLLQEVHDANPQGPNDDNDGPIVKVQDLPSHKGRPRSSGQVARHLKDAGYLGVKDLAQIDDPDQSAAAPYKTGFYLTRKAYEALGIAVAPKPAEERPAQSEPNPQEQFAQEPQSEIRELPQEEPPEQEKPRPEYEDAAEKQEQRVEVPLEPDSDSMAIPTLLDRRTAAPEVQPEPSHQPTPMDRDPDAIFSGETKHARAEAVFAQLRSSVREARVSAREAEEQLDPLRREASVAGWDLVGDLDDKGRKRLVKEAVKRDPRVRVQRKTANGIYLKLAKAMLGVGEGIKPADYSNLATLWRFAGKGSLSAAMLDQFITEHHGYRRAYPEARKGLEDPRARTEAIQIHERRLEDVAIPSGTYSSCLNSKDFNLEHLPEGALVLVVFRKRKSDPTTGDLEPRFIWRDAPTVEVEKLILTLSKRHWPSHKLLPSNRRDKYR